MRFRRVMLSLGLGSVLLISGVGGLMLFFRVHREAHTRAGQLAPGTVFRDVETALRPRVPRRIQSSAELKSSWERLGPGGEAPLIPEGGEMLIFLHFDDPPIHWVALDRGGRVQRVLTTRHPRR